MIDLINSEAEIITSERDLDFGHVIEQNTDSITVEYMHINSLVHVYRKYEYPEAFLNGEIRVKGDANGVLLRDLELIKQLEAVNSSIDLLEFDEDDPAYEALHAKRTSIKRELAGIQSEFENKVKEKEIAQHQYYVKRDEGDLEDSLITLAKTIEEIERLRDDLNSYSGLKISKKYKNLKTSYERARDSISTWTWSIERTEERLQGEYEFLGVDYKPKYSHLGGKTYKDLVDAFAELELPIEKAVVGGRVKFFPFGFRIFKESAEGVVLTNDDGYYIECFLGKNPRLRDLEDDARYEITRVERASGDSAVRYVWDADEFRAFHYEEEIIYGSGAFYTTNVFRDLDDNVDAEAVKEEIYRLERMV